MTQANIYTVQIDHLPEKTIEAGTPEEASTKVRDIVLGLDLLKPLADDEPVQIKGPDRRPWGRNLTLGDFRRGPVTIAEIGSDDPEQGPTKRPDPDD